jgi:hypothetical protein
VPEVVELEAAHLGGFKLWPMLGCSDP